MPVNPVRVFVRLGWMAGEFALAAACYAAQCACCPQGSLPGSRAVWLQKTARRFLRVLGVSIQVRGPVPLSGVLVCNHLSYVDIIVLGALAPAVFVAKRDVKSWPVFGWFARLAGTVFVDRARRMHVGHTTNEIQSHLDRGMLVVLFPEGTSSGGETVLPFKSSFLEPAVRSNAALWAGWIGYKLAGGNTAEEVCYWKDMTFLPHLLNLLSKRGVQATVCFAKVQRYAADRKELARQLHAEVLQLKSGVAIQSKNQSQRIHHFAAGSL